MSILYTGRAELYDLIYSWKDYDGEIARLHQLLLDLGVPEGGAVLDAACGTGKHLAGLANWFRVSGFDGSDSMLAVARKRLDVPLWRADLETFTVPEPVDAVTCLFSAIGYLLDEASLRASARSFARAVKPGGALLVEPWLTTETWDVGRPFAQSHTTPQVAVARVNVAERDGDYAIMDMHWHVAPRGGPVEAFTDHHRMWLCPHETLLAAFRDAGFDCRIEPDGLMPGRGLLVGTRRGTGAHAR